MTYRLAEYSLEVDLSNSLDLTQLVSLLPPGLREARDVTELHEWLQIFDVNEDGRFDVHDVFRFAISKAAHCYGRDAVRAAFAQHVTNATTVSNSLRPFAIPMAAAGLL